MGRLDSDSFLDRADRPPCKDERAGSTDAGGHFVLMRVTAAAREDFRRQYELKQNPITKLG